MLNRSSPHIHQIPRVLAWSLAVTGLATFVFAREQTGGWVDAATLWHLAVGMLLGLVCCLVWISKRNLAGGLQVPILTVSGLSGIALLAWAALGRSVARIDWILWIHIIAGISVAIVWAARLFRRRPAVVAASAAVLAMPALALSGYSADAYFRAVTSTSAVQSNNLGFPSLSRVAETEWRNSSDKTGCIRSGCHSAEYLGAHEVGAGCSPEFLQAFNQAHSDLGPDGAQWCLSCHDPLNRVVGLNDPQAGTCQPCHFVSNAITPGGGWADYRSPASYPFGHSAPWIHDVMLRARPLPHAVSTRVQSEACMACHRMRVTPVQNGFQRVALDDVWGSWLHGPYSGRSLHATAGLLPTKSCVDCHMPTTQSGFHDHRLNPAPVTYRVEIFALRRGTGEQGAVERFDAPIHARNPVLRGGESVVVDVVVRADGIGHSHAPPGLRLEMTASDESGKLLLRAEPHVYGPSAVDRQGSPVPHARAYAAIATLNSPTEGLGHGAPIGYRALQPGYPDVVRYRLTIPNSPIRLNATLLRDSPTQRPNDPTTQRPASQLATDSFILGGPASTGGLREDASYARRFYEYGLGLFEQNDVAHARRAFQQALSLDNSKADYWIALGRLDLQGDLLAARSSFQEALKRAPGSQVARAWLGRVHSRMARLDDALALLGPLAKQYPEDAQMWLDIGLCEMRSGRAEQAAEAFERMLSIDPDDPSGHLNLMTCYRQMNKLSLARIEEGAYRAIQPIPAPRAILDQIERNHPELLLEQQPIHEHRLTTTVQGGRR